MMPPFIAPKTEVKVKELRSNSSTHSFSLQSKTFLNCNHVVVRQGKYLKYYSYFDPIWSLDQYLGQNLPSYLPSYKEDNPVLPSCDSVKVEIVVHEGTIKIPFVAHLASGNSKWSVPKFPKFSQSAADIQLHTREVAGEYTGTDATMIKMELSEVSIKRTKKQNRNIRHTSPQTSLLEGNRKVSRM